MLVTSGSDYGYSAVVIDATRARMETLAQLRRNAQRQCPEKRCRNETGDQHAGPGLSKSAKWSQRVEACLAGEFYARNFYGCLPNAPVKRPW
jgi:hypothetical protein